VCVCVCVCACARVCVCVWVFVYVYVSCGMCGYLYVCVCIFACVSNIMLSNTLIKPSPLIHLSYCLESSLWCVQQGRKGPDWCCHRGPGAIV
jgi:hypothetical protein